MSSPTDEASSKMDVDDGAGSRENQTLDETQLAAAHGLPPPELGNPLLPGPIARTVTLGTGTIRGAVRTARSVGRVPFYAARYTTAAGIELGRQAFEAVLGQTGRSLYAQYATRGGDGNDTNGEAERARVASVVASTFDAAHRGFHYLQLFTAAGFELTGSSVATLMDLSEVLLLLVDSTLGSTESSRALRSIVSFLSREFQNPATGLPGERVGVRDLLWGLCGLVYLQSACQRLDEQERSRQAIETVIWDVVVLDGQRVDVHENSLYGEHRGVYKQWPQDAAQHVDRREAGVGNTQELPEALIRRQILDTVPSDTKIVVSTSTARIITVDITGSQPPPPISPPPGVEFVELSPLNPSAASTAAASPQVTTYRIVFRVNMNDLATTLPPATKTPHLVEQVDEPETEPEANSKQSTTTPLATPPLKLETEEQQKTTSTAAVSREPTPVPRTSSMPSPASQQQHSLANQKKVRLPAATTSSSGRLQQAGADKPSVSERGSVGKRASDRKGLDNEKKGSTGIRAVLKRPGLGNLLHKEAITQPNQKNGASSSSQVLKAPAAPGKATPAAVQPPTKKSKIGTSTGVTVQHLSPPTSVRSTTLSTSRNGPSSGPKTQMVLTPLTSRALFRHELPPTPRDGEFPQDGYGNLQRKRRSLDLESVASLASLASSFADNVSIHVETEQNHAGDEGDYRQTLARSPSLVGDVSGSGLRRHKSRGNRGSIYTLHTNDSQTSLVLSAYGPGRRSMFDSGYRNANNASGGNAGTAEALDEVRRTGRVPGMFPAAPLLSNLQRYMRFSSAAYGRDFLRALGISQYFGNSVGGGRAEAQKGNPATQPSHHREIASYAQHTGVAPDDIVMASFIDTHGAPDAEGQPRVPLVHYITFDHASRAVVLACRGTLGFEDILADMACEYDNLYWRGRTYQVHKGVHASARRLLYGGDGRVLATLRDALQQYPDYGLVLCGHSLGGAVTALLGVMLSEPRPTVAGTVDSSPGRSFQTSAMPPRLLVSEDTQSGRIQGPGREVPSLPPGRPVHVFAYGPPGTMSPGLCKATRGLITSVVQGNDLVPYLSLGVLHDFQAVALAFKTDDSQASAELWGRLWDKFRSILAQKWYGAGSGGRMDATKDMTNPADDAWAYSALKTLRASMLSQKLLPPGEVLIVETQRVLQRTTYGGSHPGSAGGALPHGEASEGANTLLMVSPARRVVLKYVRDVEARFREIRFGLAAFADHSPGRYEKALDQLVAGVQL